jgi:hypothetical protein
MDDDGDCVMLVVRLGELMKGEDEGDTLYTDEESQ